MKYFLASLILSSAVMTSCGEEKVDSTESDSKTEKVAEKDEAVIEELDEIAEDDYSEGSIQSQWDDIVAQVKAGEKENLNMYLDKGPAFSQEEWDYIDLTAEEYYISFSAYDSFNDLPNAENMGEGTKVVSVYFETENDGEIFESTALIYLVLEDGLIWINGCELIG